MLYHSVDYIQRYYNEKELRDGYETPKNPIVKISPQVTSFSGSRDVEICLCGSGKTETEIAFLNPDVSEEFDPCVEDSFSRIKRTKYGDFNLNLYVYEGPGYGFGDQPLREAHIFYLQYDRSKRSSLANALLWAKRIKRVREDYVQPSLFVLAANGHQYTVCTDKQISLKSSDATVRNLFLSRFSHDTFLVSFILSFADMYFISPESSLSIVTREEGLKAARVINATYVETNSFTTRGIGLAFATCMNIYINAYAKKKDLVNSKDNPKGRLRQFSTKSAIHRCVKFASKTLNRKVSLF